MYCKIMTYPNFYDNFLIYYDISIFLLIFASEKGNIMEAKLSKDFIYSLVAYKGMTKAEFAKKVGLERNNLDSALNSKKKDINFVIKMAEALDLPLMTFIGAESGELNMFGCIYVNGVPVIVNSRKEIEELLEKVKTAKGIYDILQR